MWDFDPDEFFFLLVAAFVTVVWVNGYVFRVLAVSRLRPNGAARFILLVVPLACIGFTFVVLQCYADDAVRNHADYLTLFLAGLILFFECGRRAMRVLGLNIHDHVLGSPNPAALCLAVAAMIAIAIIYAASNIGSGPTIWTTLVPAAVAAIALGMLWIVMNVVAGTMLDSILIDRDVASALRAGGALVGCAIILGRAAAGRWVDWPQTFSDLFELGWLAIAVASAAAIVHRMIRPTPEYPRRPIGSYGLAPALAFVGFGLLVVALEPNGFHPAKW